jgi:hypothetical protein
MWKLAQGQHAGFVAPEFVGDLLAVDPSPESFTVVGAESAPKCEVMRTIDNIHAVQLQGPSPLQVLGKTLSCEFSLTRSMKTLALKPEPTNFFNFDTIGLGH